ncbi:hypothetical protein [Pinibacter aurantiacus]|uniref:Tail fiber domain-containing protein n=1 Tax=Pinibacter aurantiacus TaxID=2851599 RepID=A0A9E2SFQ5_9BACT|nr:hypothetical protein [Pinibacter aurantiacus]MBV4360614.1 hypothetical protein [Pinibacter aurantiacus]
MKKVLTVLILMIVFNEGYSQAWGIDSSRTEVRDDAGLRGDAGAKSGFFETVHPVNYPVGYPTGGNSAWPWWHLLDVRHGDKTNNYAMQFTGSFFDQNFYCRKVANNPAQPWSRILTEDSDGDVGIGTDDPRYPLHIKSSAGFLMNLESSLSFSGFLMRAASTTKQMGMYYWSDNFQNNSLRIARYNSVGAWEANAVIFGLNAPNGSLVLSDAGYLGIGTMYPSEMLSVKGNVRAKKVIVTQLGWADYVFEPSYRLPSLDSVSSYIKTNKHLPGMVSADVIEKQGLDVGEIVKQQQEKIEELMLYIIQLKEEIKVVKESAK